MITAIYFVVVQLNEQYVSKMFTGFKKKAGFEQ